jgi:hypothetical protein
MRCRKVFSLIVVGLVAVVAPTTPLLMATRAFNTQEPASEPLPLAAQQQAQKFGFASTNMVRGGQTWHRRKRGMLLWRRRGVDGWRLLDYTRVFKVQLAIFS